MTQAVALAQQASTGVSPGFRNRIINGAMTIDQRNAGAAVTAGNSYPVDRFQYQIGGGIFTLSLQQSSVAPVGFTNSLFATVTSSGSVGAGDYALITQRIEGYNIADLNFGSANAKTITLSFWVRSSVTGTFGGVINNSSSNRSYPYTYTISAANTWEQKSVTIAGDTTGTWDTTNGVGFQVRWSLGTGSTFSGTAGAWSSSTFFSATGSTSLVTTGSATFYITGVQLEVGSTATSFDYRPYGTELALCQRYYYKVKASGNSYSNLGTGYNTATTTANFMVFFPVTLRIRPTALETSGTAGDYAVAHTNTATTCSVVPTYSAPTNEFQSLTIFTVSSGLTAGQGSRGCSELNNANAYLAWSAEL